MKTKCLTLILLVLTLIGAFSLTGCLFSFVNDEDIAKKNIAKLVDVIQKKDKAGVKALFAPNKIAGLENFDKRIDDLFAYIDGEYVSHTKNGAGTTKDVHYGRVIKYQEMSNDVTTTTGIIRFAIVWTVEDNGDAGNVGIWSLYVLKFEDDPNQDYYYRGDGLGTIGINIGKPYPEILKVILSSHSFCADQDIR